MIEDFLRQKNVEELAPLIEAWSRTVARPTPELHALGIDHHFAGLMVWMIRVEILRRENEALRLRELTDQRLRERLWMLSAAYSRSRSYSARLLIRQDEKAIEREQARRDGEQAQYEAELS